MGTRVARYMYKLLPLRLNKRPSPILQQDLLIGKVLPGRTPYERASMSALDPSSLLSKDNKVEVRVPYHVYDEYFKGFFEHEWDFVVVDEHGECKSGDAVLIQRLGADAPDSSRPTSLRTLASIRNSEHAREQLQVEEASAAKPVSHRLVKVVHRCGDVRDPISGEAVVAERTRTQIRDAAAAYGTAPNAAGTSFDYDKAPPRGRLEGRRDFTDRRTYWKWHKFRKDDKYGLIA